MIDNQPLIHTVTNVPNGYPFPNGMTRAQQFTVVWQPGPDYKPNGEPVSAEGCLLETPVEAVKLRIGTILHESYVDAIFSPEKLEEAKEYLDKALDCMRMAWQPSIEPKQKQESKQEPKHGNRQKEKTGKN